MPLQGTGDREVRGGEGRNLLQTCCECTGVCGAVSLPSTHCYLHPCLCVVQVSNKDGSINSSKVLVKVERAGRLALSRLSGSLEVRGGGVEGKGEGRGEGGRGQREGGRGEVTGGRGRGQGGRAGREGRRVQ